jgi:hypothetical protein
MRLNPEERYDVDQAMSHRWMKENSLSLTPPDALITTLTPNEGTPSPTPVESQDLLPPPVNHSSAKKSNFNPVFWSIRQNRSATLNGDLISDFDHNHGCHPHLLSQSDQSWMTQSSLSSQSQSRITNHSSQATPTVASVATASVVNDDIDEFSSDEDSKHSVTQSYGKKSTPHSSRVKSKFVDPPSDAHLSSAHVGTNPKTEKSSRGTALTLSKEENLSLSRNYSPSNMSRKRAEMLTVKKPPEPRKRLESNGIMEQLVKKRSRKEHSSDVSDAFSSTLSDVISSPSRPPLSTSLASSSTAAATASVRTPPLSISHLPQSRTHLPSASSVSSSSTRSRRSQGERTIANMFDRTAVAPAAPPTSSKIVK